MQYLCIVHVHVHGQYALCGYTRHLSTCRYAAILANRPSGIFQAVAIAVNDTKGVKHLASYMYVHLADLFPAVCYVYCPCIIKKGK